MTKMPLPKCQKKSRFLVHLLHHRVSPPMNFSKEEKKMGKSHVLAIPYPAQGHVIPLLEVTQCLANNGLRVSFVNTEFNHERVIKAFSQTGSVHELISLVSIPDGLEPWEDRNDQGKLAEATLRIMPGNVEALIQKINQTESDGVTCVLADCYMTAMLTVAEKFGFKKAAFLPGSVALLASILNAQKLIDDGIVDVNGTPLKKELFQLSPSMPKMNPLHFSWTCFPDINTQRTIFHSMIESNESAKLAQRLICNSSHALEPGTLDFMPQCSPVGPLLASTRLGSQAGHFWPEDPSSLEWLDQQKHDSVIYVAFGIFTIFDPIQFRELALGLELTNRPFLWVVRQDITQDIDKAYPVGFMDRVRNRGKMVHWAPQQRILAHASVACFLSHCGWNSTVEGLSNGVPFLCWPYFADQFLNQSYILDHWGIGLGFEKDEGGIIRREEIRVKVEELLSDESYKLSALKLQAKTGANVEGGSSQENLLKFVDWIKEN